MKGGFKKKTSDKVIGIGKGNWLSFERVCVCVCVCVIRELSTSKGLRGTKFAVKLEKGNLGWE